MWWLLSVPATTGKIQWSGSPSPAPAQANHPLWDWGIRGLRAESTHTCANLNPHFTFLPSIFFLPLPTFLPPHPVLSLPPPFPLICCLAAIFCRWLVMLLQLPWGAKAIIRNSDDSAPWCTTLSCSVAMPLLWLTFSPFLILIRYILWLRFSLCLLSVSPILFAYKIHPNWFNQCQILYWCRTNTTI